MKRFTFSFFSLFTLMASIVLSPLSALSPEGDGAGARILVIPLDDRPPCLQWVALMAPVGGAEVVSPPRELLGRFMEFGDPEAIGDWVRGRDLDEFDALIVSLDMLAYGGLVASRVHSVDTERALGRLALLEEIREARPDLPVYGFNIIMRLAPTADGTNDAWRGALARWAELAPQAKSDAEAAEEVGQLESRIPEEVLADYRRARARNLEVNRAAVRLAAKRTIDYLVLGQDDAKPQGVHVADREALIEKIDTAGVADRVAVQPGADELGMLLLARAMSDRRGETPRIRAVYSSETSRRAVAPYEDRPLHETVTLQIAAAGAKETADDEADLLYFVYASRHEADVAESFARNIARAVGAGRRVIVADVDTRGNVQGGSREFTDSLIEHGVFTGLYGYASWNTAGNTLGTALPQGILHFLATDRGAPAEGYRTKSSPGPQLTFLLHRLINDYLYQGRVRPEINRVYARERGMNPNRLDADQTVRLERVILERVESMAETYLGEIGLPGAVSGLSLTLPWGRTFEAEIDFVLTENAVPEDGEAANAGDGFTRHGVAAEVSRSRGAIVVEAAAGEHRLAVWLQDHRGGYGILLIDPENGETTFHEMPFTTWDSPFAVLYSGNGYLYSLFGHHFVEFDPRTGEFTHVESSEDRVAMWMTEDDDGVVWAGNYPDAHLVSFDPGTREYTDHGPLNRENWPQYPRALAAGVDGWVYAMIGFTNNHILAFDPGSGEVREMVDEGDRAGGNVTLWRGEDGAVYARMPADGSPWLRMSDGEATALEGAPPVERVDEISGNQGAFFGDLPDGRRITRLNLPEGWIEVAAAEGDEPRRVPFEYPSDGSWIYTLALGPDGRIYGSTGHPLRFFAYDPVRDSFWDTAVQGGHINAMTVQADKLYGAIYTQGILIEYEPGRRGTSDAPNPARVASAGDILLRPHDLLAHSDGRHVIQVGTPGYGRTGGGMMVYDVESGEAEVYGHAGLIEHHSTKALAELPDGNLIGGTSTAPGTGGERIAEECLLYIMEWPSLDVLYREAILPGVQEIRELTVGAGDLVFGLDVEGTFFVFDWRAREVVHRENLSAHYGPITGGQAPRVWERGPNGILYAVFREAVVRIDPSTFEHGKLAATPVEVNCGVALHEGRLYFTSGSHVWSYAIPELR